MCWVKRFLNNSQLKSIGKKARGPLPTTKKDFHVKCMIRIYRRTFESDADLEIKLPKEQQRTYHERSVVDYSIFITESTLLAEQMLEKAHFQILHGGIGLSMK